jgi:hypothetical protein
MEAMVRDGIGAQTLMPSRLIPQVHP